MSNGIISQYGFLYQREVFVLHALKSMNTNSLFTFEGKDDIEINSDEKIYSIKTGNYYIQVKSGTVNEDCFSRVICNWLLIDHHKSSKFELVLEYDLGFDFSSRIRAEKILDFIISGQTKKKTSIARKTYEKYKEKISNKEDILNLILGIISSFEKSVYSMERIDQELLEKFCQDYCSDIRDFTLAKKKRLERFISYIDTAINEAIKQKNQYTMIYSDFMNFIIKVLNEISDHKYKIDTLCIKKKSKEKAQELVNERISREVKQLYLVNDDDNFVVDGIVHELIYKDFRDVYSEQKILEISNLEQNAKENHNSSLFCLGKDKDNPRKVFIETTSQELESDLLPKGQIYRKGCYIYLTGDNVSEDFQITWGEDNDTE